MSGSADSGGGEQSKSTSLHTVQEVFRSVSGMVEAVRVKLETRGVREKVDELAKELAREDLWDNPDRAGKISREHAALADMIESLDAFTTAMDNAVEMATMADEEGETQVIADCLSELDQIETQVKRFHLNMLLDHPADRLGCIIELAAGAGGTESCDWTEMLLDMYKRWGEQSGYQSTITDTSPGTEAGLRSAVLQISGLNAYGWAKAETGVHRMVRISEYDSNGRRQTCFAQVNVMPLMDDDDDNFIEIDPADLKIDTYRASGAGGQHVNTTESAVRVTHLPTGVIAQCQAERSQHRNKAMAMSVLRSRLLERKLQAERDARREQRNSLGDNSWGNQIRSYVLHPYKLVKDHRTNHETPQALAVLKGEPEYLTPFMESYLAQTAADEDAVQGGESTSSA
ncbi:Peptide chain release factor 1 [Hondaea fermentalgiana]|uniref:Peptide chain release factor 1 n=1 Tax=Hondaea fermentalgiana TaxID=2315210 RepID=A0A2R5GPF3_9STRA|nr:Peptide chain release factor 1 [Hondaea fermentalgiana]|eukprot:GBG29754.1 Peptide chain release factor 1 [Hondaea fermentalgiana]